MVNISFRFRYLVALIVILVATNAFAQPVTAFVEVEDHVLDLREFRSSLRPESGERVSFRAPDSDMAAPDTIRWIDRIHNMPDYLLDFYNRYCVLVHEVLEGGNNYLSDPDTDFTNAIHFSDNSCSVIINQITRKVDYSFPEDVDYTDPYAKQQYALEAVNNDISENVFPLIDEVDIFFPYLFLCMDYDNPQAFWIGNNIKWGSSYSYSWNFMQCAGKDAVQYTYYILFKIKDKSFDYRIDKYRTAQAVKDGVTEFNSLVSNILAGVPETNRYEQVRYLNDWLTTHNCYSSAVGEDDFPDISFSPITALRGTGGTEGPICEGYSRAFKVLCDRLDIPCIIAVGNAKAAVNAKPEDHMWNELKMDDGLWYAVDVTWNDPVRSGNYAVQSGYENEFWLLLGKNDVVATNLTFAQSHPNSVVCSQEQADEWDLDTNTLIADNRYDVSDGVIPVKESVPVTVYSLVGIKTGTYGSMAQALSDLPDGLYIINNHKVLVRH